MIFKQMLSDYPVSCPVQMLRYNIHNEKLHLVTFEWKFMPYNKINYKNVDGVKWLPLKHILKLFSYLIGWPDIDNTGLQKKFPIIIFQFLVSFFPVDYKYESFFLLHAQPFRNFLTKL